VTLYCFPPTRTTANLLLSGAGAGVGLLSTGLGAASWAVAVIWRCPATAEPPVGRIPARLAAESPSPFRPECMSVGTVLASVGIGCALAREPAPPTSACGEGPAQATEDACRGRRADAHPTKLLTVIRCAASEGPFATVRAHCMPKERLAIFSGEGLLDMIISQLSRRGPPRRTVSRSCTLASRLRTAPARRRRRLQPLLNPTVMTMPLLQRG
jgi:hypothetical protein